MEFSHRNVNDYFTERLNDLQCLEETRAYIISIFGKYTTAQFDFSQCSATLLFAQAQANHNFLLYQSLGDWLFFARTIFPAALKNASEDYYNTIAQLSYYSCYRIIPSWKSYQELADQFIVLTEKVKQRIPNQANFFG